MPALEMPSLSWLTTIALPTNSCFWPSNTLLPGLLKTLNALAQRTLQVLPQQCPTPSSVVLDTEPCPRGWSAQPKRPHRSPGPGGGRPVCASSRPPRCCASSSRAPVPAHLLPVGLAPRPSVAVSSSLPPRPAVLPPPRAPWCLPSWGRSAPGAPAPRSRTPRPCPLPRYPPALLSPLGAPPLPVPPHPAAPVLASRPVPGAPP